MAHTPTQAVNDQPDRGGETDETAVRPPSQISLTYQRVYDLDGIEVLSRAKGGDGRTVEAYAAVFDVRKEIHDQHGDYIEENDPAMFNRTIKNGAARRALVLYNHGFDARGKSGGLPTVPIGRPVKIEADRRGLLTVSRYNNSEFADMVLESIKNGDITAQSYEGPIYRSSPDRVPKVRRGGPLPVVRRLEMGLKNYGPTPTPYYGEAEITAVRSVIELAEDFARLDAEQREELIRALSTTPGWDPETAAILATPHRGPGAEDSRDTHSVRQKAIRLKAELLARGI
ncbi:HK97 family phage prohead protease [Krasilnikovia sp. MM14-A1259]|uniref:HK97 family phage prohead protease n=1 Tax=Krasilnikovia sp. MM14-A1259 TaxID=3373539 RepID=UPI00381C19A4